MLENADNDTGRGKRKAAFSGNANRATVALPAWRPNVARDTLQSAPERAVGQRRSAGSAGLEQGEDGAPQRLGK